MNVSFADSSRVPLKSWRVGLFPVVSEVIQLGHTRSSNLLSYDSPEGCFTLSRRILHKYHSQRFCPPVDSFHTVSLAKHPVVKPRSSEQAILENTASPRRRFRCWCRAPIIRASLCTHSSEMSFALHAFPIDPKIIINEQTCGKNF